MQASAFKRVAQELKELITSPPEGIQVFEDDNISEIQASISGPAGTPYEGGVFRMKLKLGADFPQAPPKGFFQTKIFHPNVSKTGEICVNTLKKDWKEDLGIKHVLLTVKCLLIVPNAESALNEEAGRLLLENYEEYCKIAKMWTGIHATARSASKETLSLSKSGSAIKMEKEGETTTSTTDGDQCTKENSDTNSNNEGASATEKKTAVTVLQKKAGVTLDKKRSLKRL